MGLQPSCPMLIPEFAIENLDSKNIVASAENSAILLMKNTKIETNEESLIEVKGIKQSEAIMKKKMKVKY